MVTLNPHKNTFHKPKKLTLFTYRSPLIRKIPNLFRETNVCVVFTIQWNLDLSFFKGVEKTNDEYGETINPENHFF
jgi:hypothetical protein